MSNEITNVIINGKDNFELWIEAKFDLMDPNWGEDSNRTQAETQLDLRWRMENIEVRYFPRKKWQLHNDDEVLRFNIVRSLLR